MAVEEILARADAWQRAIEARDLAGVDRSGAFILVDLWIDDEGR